MFVSNVRGDRDCVCYACRGDQRQEPHEEHLGRGARGQRSQKRKGPFLYCLLFLPVARKTSTWMMSAGKLCFSSESEDAWAFRSLSFCSSYRFRSPYDITPSHPPWMTGATRLIGHDMLAIGLLSCGVVWTLQGLAGDVTSAITERLDIN